MLVFARSRIDGLFAARADPEACLVESWVEVLWPVGEPSERSGFACELPRGLFAPLQVGRSSRVLFAATRNVMFSVLGELVEGGRVEQSAFAQEV
jgi:hypothetical protein